MCDLYVYITVCILELQNSEIQLLWKYRNYGIMYVGKHAKVSMYLHMCACTCAHTADLKAYGLSCLHIGIPTY